MMKPLLQLDESDYSEYVPPQPISSPNINNNNNNKNNNENNNNNHETVILPGHIPESNSNANINHNNNNNNINNNNNNKKFSIKEIEALLKMPYAQALDEVRSDKANQKCFECGGGQTTWVSLYLGVFLCLNCAGGHRGLGSHISFVRSVNLDSWQPQKLLYVIIGGNTRAQHYFNLKNGIIMKTSLSVKYTDPVATDYKLLLQNEHDDVMMKLVRSGVVAAPNATSSANSSAPVVLQKYENATSISSDQLFNNERERKSSRCCC